MDKRKKNNIMVINTSNNFNASLNTQVFDFLRIKLLWIWNEVNANTKKKYWAIVPNAKIINFMEKRYLVHKNPMDLSFCYIRYKCI